MIDKSLDDRKFIADSNISYLILNYEDFALRDAKRFYEKGYFDKIYSLGYYSKCPMPFLGKELGYACYYNSTEILVVNSLVPGA